MYNDEYDRDLLSHNENNSSSEFYSSHDDEDDDDDSSEEEMDKLIKPHVREELLENYPFSLPKEQYLSQHQIKRKNSKSNKRTKFRETEKLKIDNNILSNDKLDILRDDDDIIGGKRVDIEKVGAKEVVGKGEEEDREEKIVVGKKLLDPILQFFKNTKVMDCCPPSSLVVALSNQLTIKEVLCIISNNKVPHGILIDGDKIVRDINSNDMENVVFGMVTVTDLINILIFWYENQSNSTNVNLFDPHNNQYTRKGDIFQMTLKEWRELMLLKKEWKMNSKREKVENSKFLGKTALMNSMKEINRDSKENLPIKLPEKKSNLFYRKLNISPSSPLIPFQGLEKEVYFISENDNLWKAVEILQENNIHRLPVLNEAKSSILTILCDSDILNFFCMFFSSVTYSNENDFTTFSLEEEFKTTSYLTLPIFRKTLKDLKIGDDGGVVTIKKDDNLYKALLKFSRYQLSILPILNKQGAIIEVLTKQDIVELIRGYFFVENEDRLNLEISVSEAVKVARKTKVKFERRSSQTNNRLLYGFTEGDDRIEVEDDDFVDGDYNYFDSDDQFRYGGRRSSTATTNSSVLRFICKKEEDLGRVIKHLTGISSHRLVYVDDLNRMLGVVSVSDIFKFLYEHHNALKEDNGDSDKNNDN